MPTQLEKTYQWICHLTDCVDTLSKIRCEKIGTARKSGDSEPNGKTILLASTHPDDGPLTGGIALRAALEGWKVVNLALTLGSKERRREARLKEDRASCAFLGWEHRQVREGGLNPLNRKTAGEEAWRAMVRETADKLREIKPDAIIMPHLLDGNRTHQGASHLMHDALNVLGTDLRCTVLETGFWGQIPKPNLMVELSREDVAELVTAVYLHTGEIERNPYHGSLPSTLIHQVRLYGEAIGGAGCEPPQFKLAEAYQMSGFVSGILVPMLPSSQPFISSDDPVTPVITLLA